VLLGVVGGVASVGEKGEVEEVRRGGVVEVRKLYHSLEWLV